MGLFDKWKGRAKQAAGDMTGSAATRREGLQEERAADAKEEAARAEEHAEQTRRGERARRTSMTERFTSAAE